MTHNNIQQLSTYIYIYINIGVFMGVQFANINQFVWCTLRRVKFVSQSVTE